MTRSRPLNSLAGLSIALCRYRARLEYCWIFQELWRTNHAFSDGKMIQHQTARKTIFSEKKNDSRTEIIR